MTFAKAIETLKAVHDGTLNDTQIIVRDFLNAYNIYGILNAIREDARFLKVFDSCPPPVCVRASLRNALSGGGLNVPVSSTEETSRSDEELPYKPWNYDGKLEKGTLTIPSRHFIEIAQCIPAWKIAEVDECLAWFAERGELSTHCSTDLHIGSIQIPAKYFNVDNTIEGLKAHTQLLSYPTELKTTYGDSFVYLDAAMHGLNTFEGKMFAACLMDTSFGYTPYYQS